MIAVIDSLKSSWEGEAATAYNTRFHELDEDMEKMHRMIAEHVKDLQDMADQYQQAETFNEEAGTSLAGDIID
jgi:WXG100 family type VII secretion target